jgi:hypothetical protein
MELTNINPRLVDDAVSLALSDYDMVTKKLADEFENRKRAKTRRKYYLFGEEIQYTASKSWFESAYEWEIRIAECCRAEDKKEITNLGKAARTALDIKCSLTLNKREWSLIKNYLEM